MQENYTQLHFTVKTPPVAKGRPKFSRRGAYVQAYTPTKTINAEREIARGFLLQFPEFAASASDKSVLSRVELGQFAAMSKKSRKNRYADISSSNARNADGQSNSGQFASGEKQNAKIDIVRRSSRRNKIGCSGNNERNENSEAYATEFNRLPRCCGPDIYGHSLPCEQLKDAAREHGIALTCEFYCPIPSSLSKRKREQLNGELCLKKPDIDNYVKLVCDALNGIAWEDDNVVASLYAVKLYDNEPRTEVYIDYLQNNA